MANEEHLAILKKGVKEWNKWREENPVIRPDLRRAHLEKRDLRGINFHNAILDRIYLNSANLSENDLSSASLGCSKLINADLSYANLKRTYFGEADLNNSNFKRADLYRADLKNANLSSANLQEAYLGEADLNETNLVGANLSGADLWRTNLVDAKCDNVTLSRAKLWGTQTSGWSIKGIICTSVYWDKEAKILKKYKPGEFEKLHSGKPIIILHYSGGITTLEFATLPGMITKLASEHPGCILRLHALKHEAGEATVEIVMDESGGTDASMLRQELERTAQQWQNGIRTLLEENVDSVILRHIELSNSRLIDAVVENTKAKTAEISKSLSSVMRNIDKLASSQQATQESIEELVREISSLPPPMQNTLLGLLTNIAAAPGEAWLLEIIKRLATR